MVMLSRIFCVILISIFFNVTTKAQVITGSTPIVAEKPIEQLPAQLVTRADTARAVHELFVSRRWGGFAWITVGTVGILAATLPALQSTSAGVWDPGVVGGAALLGLGVKKSIQFKGRVERQVLKELAETGHLPKPILRRLHGDFLPLHGSDGDFDDYNGSDGVTFKQPAKDSVQRLSDAHQDTLDAVQGFFNSKRDGGRLPLVLALPGLRLLSGATATNSSPAIPGQTQNTEVSGGRVAAGLLLAGGGLVYMLVHNAPYTDEKFAEVRNNYLAGKGLPASIRAKLKPKHYVAGRIYREKMERKAARHKHSK